MLGRSPQPMSPCRARNGERLRPIWRNFTISSDERKPSTTPLSASFRSKALVSSHAGVSQLQMMPVTLNP